jgi:autotransporter-associated beta strand protein
MKPKQFVASLSSITSFVLAFSQVSSLHASAISWNGGTESWDTTTNWTPNALPTSSDTAVFGGTTGTVTATAAQSVMGLQFTSSGYTLGGAALTIGTGGIDANSLTGGTTTIDNSITPTSGSQRWNVGTGATLAVGSFPSQFGPGGGIVIFSKTGTITTTAANGWDWRGGGPGLLGPGFVIDNGNGTYDWGYKGAGNVVMAPSYMAAGTGDKNNAKITSNTTLNLNASWASILVDGATFTINGTQLYVDTGIILQNGATIAGSRPIKSNNDGLYLYAGNGGGTISTSIQNNGATAKALYKAGSGSLTLSGTDTYTGATNIYGGALNVSGGGNINTTSGITVSGNDAKYIHTSSTASTRTITLTQGTVDGTGTLGIVNVANLAGNTITNGNGTGSGTLTIGTLAFAGSGSINANEAGTTNGLALTTFTTPNTGTGEIIINAANSSGWSSGTTYDLITYTSLTGTLADFTTGTITGISGRQSATLGNSGTAITLTVAGDNPVWTGTGSQTWTTAPTNDSTGPNAWALKTAHTATNFWANDASEFNDTYNLGSGNTAVTNSTVTITGGVAPVSTTFNNSVVNYTINSSDSTGITAGALSKSGAGTVTLNTVNSYTDATTINEGSLIIGGSGSLGSGNYAGPITNNGTFNYNSSAAQTLSGIISGTGAVTVNGSGVLSLSGANSFSGQLSVESGKVSIASVNNADTNGPLGKSFQSVILGGTGTSGTLQYTGGAGSVTTTKAFTLATGGTGTIQVDNASAELKLTASNGLTGDGQLIKTGAGTLAMGDAGHDYSGGTVIQNGLLQGGNTIFTANFGTGPITIGLQGSVNDATVGLGNGGVIAGNDLVVASGPGARNIFGGSGGNETFSGPVTLGDGGGEGNLNLVTLYAGSSSSKLILSNTVSGTGNINMYAKNLYNSGGSHDVTLSGTQDQTGTISSIDSPITPEFPTYGVNTISGDLGAGITNVTQNSTNSTLVLGGFNTAFTGTVTVTNGTLKMGSYYALSSNNQVSIAATGTFDLNGNDEIIGRLNGTGMVTNTGSLNTLVIGGAVSHSFDGTISGNTALTVALTGGSTLTLTGTNYYTGATTVTEGILAVNGDAIPDDGKLDIDGGKVNPMGNTEVVNTLFFGATQQAAGTYGASGSGAANIDNLHFTGTGMVIVISDPPIGYSGWAEANGATGQTMDQDHDNDGVDNGIEYFMDETGSTFTPNPAAVDGIVTWPMAVTYGGVYGTDYEVQYSTDLVSWTKAEEGTGENTVTVTPGASVVYIMPTGGKSFVRLVVQN